MSDAGGAETGPRIAILGSRGIPARFGGFETCAEQLAVRLVQRGCRVTVFCERDGDAPAPTCYEGVHLRYVRTTRIVGLRSIWADLIALLSCLRGYDKVYMLGYHAAFTFMLPRLFGVELWVNMDGLEWKRAKWSAAVRTYLRWNERLATHWASSMIADAKAIGAHLKAAYPSAADKIHVIPYGVEIPPPAPEHLLNRWQLTADGYDLVVCRLEPENHVLEILRGHRSANTGRRLVIVGDHHSGSSYVGALRREGGEGVQFVGGVYDAVHLSALRRHCHVYLHGHSVGGTNPSLLESMACGNRIIAHDNPFNREVLGALGRYFTAAADVTAKLAELQQIAPDETLGARMIASVREHYDWNRITQRYLDAFGIAQQVSPSGTDHG